jgi:hypothetical protein
MTSFDDDARTFSALPTDLRSMRPFQGCRDRIERAKSHYAILSEEWNKIPAEDLYSVRANVNHDGTGVIRVTRPQPLPPIFALQVGEMLYQLRAALDGAIYTAAILETGNDPPPNEQNLEFPIFADATRYSKRSADMLGPLANHRKAIIESVQPYHVKSLDSCELAKDINRNIGILNDWARKDRHRRLHMIGGYVLDARPQISCPASVTVAEMKVIKSDFLETENVIARFRLIGYGHGMEVKVNPYLQTQIAINEIPPACCDEDTFGYRAMNILNAVYSIIIALENSF